MKKFLVFSLVGFLGFALQARAEWTEEKCEAEAKKHFGNYLLNASTARKSWPALKGSSIEHMKILGSFRKIIRENGLLKKVNDHFERSDDEIALAAKKVIDRIALDKRKAPDAATIALETRKAIDEAKEEINTREKALKRKMRSALFKAFGERYRILFGSEGLVNGWSGSNISWYPTKEKDGTEIRMSGYVFLRGKKLEININTFIEDSEDAISKYGSFLDPKSLKEPDFVHGNHQLMRTTWTIQRGKEDTVKTTMGSRELRSNPYNGNFMSFQDYLIANDLIPYACKRHFFRTGQKLTLRLDSTQTEKYKSNRSNVDRSWRIVFEDEEGNEIEAKSAR